MSLPVELLAMINCWNEVEQDGGKPTVLFAPSDVFDKVHQCASKSINSMAYMLWRGTPGLVPGKASLTDDITFMGVRIQLDTSLAKGEVEVIGDGGSWRMALRPRIDEVLEVHRRERIKKGEGTRYDQLMLDEPMVDDDEGR